MKHRILSLALLCAWPALQGCELLRHEQRSKSTDEVSDDEVEKNARVEASPVVKGFFKNTRLPGAMSDEGRDIERNLGVN